MRQPKTVKSYIKLLKQLEKIQLNDLKGYSDLDKKSKELLVIMQAEISNNVNELI